jgi:hypothetical protein
MDNLENQPVTPGPEAEMQAQMNSLKQLVIYALVLIFIVAGAINMYFWRQLRSVQTELAPLQAQSAQITAEVSKVNTAANEFAKRLIDFSKTHPDFAPILKKYNLQAPPATNAPAAAKPAAPAAPAKK